MLILQRVGTIVGYIEKLCAKVFTIDGITQLQFETVQMLSNHDLETRVHFCVAFCRLHESTRRRLWFSDECCFDCNGKPNLKNTRYRSFENQHRKIEISRIRKTVIVWAAICGDGRIVYEVYTGIQTAQKHRARLEKHFPIMDLPTHAFMQDGAPIHTASLVLIT